MQNLENETAYAISLLRAIRDFGETTPSFSVNHETSRNAAACMTALICQRLSAAGDAPEVVKQTTFRWANGVINIRNAVKGHHWTNLRLSFMSSFEEETTSFPTAFLLLAWPPGETLLHAWAVPGSLVRDAMPGFSIGEISDKRTVRITPARHIFENHEGSPDLKPFYASLAWSTAELAMLRDAVAADDGTRLQRKEKPASNAPFLDTVRRYLSERVVFFSPDRKAQYFIESIDENSCVVRRIHGEAERVTFSGYDTKLQLVQKHGRLDRRKLLDNTVARHMCYLQSPELGLSTDNQEVVYLSNDEEATDHFIEHVKKLSSPKLYKPLILLLVLEGIFNQDLRENKITFDWISPLFIRRLKAIGLNIEEQQVAEGFGRLANDLFWMLAHRDPAESLSLEKPTPKMMREAVSHATVKEPYWRAIQKPANLERVRQAILDKWSDLRDIGTSPEQKVDEKSAMRLLIDRIRAKGFVFQPWQIAAYVIALRTKPFVILAGVSGTGKTKLPMLVAELTGAAFPRRVAVRPDWTDSSDVIGYVDLQNQFRPGVVLQEMRAASMDRNRFHVCLIDEMNLARVEHYFAEFLSAIEDRRSSEGGGFESTALITQQLANDSEEWSDQTIPPNLGIVGTVNMDESTHGFSRKVLDRAFTIELSEIDLAGGLTHSTEAASNDALQDWPIENWLCPASRLDEVDLNDGLNMQDVERTIETLQRVNDVLVQAQLQVGYRTRDEVALFVINARPVLDAFVTNDGVTVDPLDLALMMKVLPRIVGGSNSIRRVLLGLLGIATSGTPLTVDADPTALIDTWEREGRPGAFANGRFPRTASRLCLMWNRLDVEGYTSYWL